MRAFSNEAAEIARTLERFAAVKDLHDVDAVVELRTDDCVDYTAATGLRLEGREAIRSYFTAFFASVPDYRGDFDGVAYGDQSAAVWGRFCGTVTDNLMGIPVEPGRKLEVPCVFVLTFRGGKVVSDHQYWDAATLAEQLGVPLEQIRRPRVRRSS
jgi:steroid delta-isomerase-like uncharacterized protein